jgi:hypothetical protein
VRLAGKRFGIVIGLPKTRRNGKSICIVFAFCKDAACEQTEIEVRIGGKTKFVVCVLNFIVNELRIHALGMLLNYDKHILLMAILVKPFCYVMYCEC